MSTFPEIPLSQAIPEAGGALQTSVDALEQTVQGQTDDLTGKAEQTAVETLGQNVEARRLEFVELREVVLSQGARLDGKAEQSVVEQQAALLEEERLKVAGKAEKTEFGILERIVEIQGEQLGAKADLSVVEPLQQQLEAQGQTNSFFNDQLSQIRESDLVQSQQTQSALNSIQTLTEQVSALQAVVAALQNSSTGQDDMAIFSLRNQAFFNAYLDIFEDVNFADYSKLEGIKNGDLILLENPLETFTTPILLFRHLLLVSDVDNPSFGLTHLSGVTYSQQSPSGAPLSLNHEWAFQDGDGAPTIIRPQAIAGDPSQPGSRNRFVWPS